jgi:Na+-driven multidrug efflux pump
VAGQNFGGRRPERVADTLKQALALELVIMAGIIAACQRWADVPVAWFTSDPQAMADGATILRILSWNFFGMGIVFACSGLFQAMGNTLPALASSMTRLLTFVLPALCLHQRAGFRLWDVWHLSVASVAMQAVVSVVLVRRQMRARLGAMR